MKVYVIENKETGEILGSKTHRSGIYNCITAVVFAYSQLGSIHKSKWVIKRYQLINGKEVK